jgi:predicted nuclease of predicted toxin-antitoxin system
VKFKIDENLALACAELLRAAGYDAMTVDEQSMSGTADHDLAKICSDEGRTLITADLDLSDMRQFPPTGTPGYIVLRLNDQSRDHQVQFIRRVVPLLVTQPLKDRLWIVDEKKVRIRTFSP